MITMTIDGKEYQLTPIAQKKKLVVKRDFNFEIHSDELGQMTWSEALKKVKELGDGWRLPTINELQLIWESDCEELLKKESYWSSSEYNSGLAFGFSFYNGNAYDDDKNTYSYVRAVRTLTI